MGLIEVDSELLARARDAGVDVSRVSERALARAIELERKRILEDEIRRDREALTQYIAEHGNPVTELNEMFGHPCAT